MERSLLEFAKHKACEVTKFEGGQHFLNRITSMGFIPGTKLSILKKGVYGPIIVQVRDTEVALGRGEAKKIIVKEVS